MLNKQKSEYVFLLKNLSKKRKTFSFRLGYSSKGSSVVFVNNKSVDYSEQTDLLTLYTSLGKHKHAQAPPYNHPLSLCHL